MSSLAIIAGEGALPVEIILGLKREGVSDPLVYSLAPDLSRYEELGVWCTYVKNPLSFGVVLAGMRLKGVRRLILAGRVPKALMYRRDRMDSQARQIVETLKDKNDHNLLGAVVSVIERFGIEVLDYESVIPDMMASVGLIAGPEPTEVQLRDLDYGWSILQSILPLSFGQALVVSQGSIVAVEAMEGTDSMILRSGPLVGHGCVVKAMREDQDRRFDIPVVGKQTLLNMSTSGYKALFIQAGSVMILDKPEFVELASELGISVVGVE